MGWKAGNVFGGPTGSKVGPSREKTRLCVVLIGGDHWGLPAEKKVISGKRTGDLAIDRVERKVFRETVSAAEKRVRP